MKKKKKNSSKNKQTKRRKKPGKLRWQTLLQKKIKHFISLESNIQLEERNYFGCNFRISVHIFSFC